MNTASSTASTGYLDSLLQGQPSASSLTWLNQLRANAVERVGALTVPTTRDEDWRFTDISPLTKLSFQPARGVAQLAPATVEQWAIAEAEARLVFVDGIYAPRHSFNRAGITVENLASGVTRHGAAVQAHLGRHAGFERNAFAALNTAFLHDGALIVVPRGIALAAPVHLLFIATRKHAASYPRCLLIAEAGSAVTLVEDFVALQNEAYFTNAVTEMTLDGNAAVHHVRVQREGAEAFHFANCAASLAHASRYHSVSVALGARISRHNLGVLMAAEGAECRIDGLALIGGRQLADAHTLIDHAMPQGLSRQLHKCIVDGAARAVFNGNIMVRSGAQRTDSSQSSRNLLLSGKARVDTKPQLEIFADDVKCAHGATVGQLDVDEVFYLNSRGLSDTAARKLLTYAFGAEVIERISVASLRNRLEQAVLAQTQTAAAGAAREA
ncbi:MAG: Fe-S cluster assembly protein SufD [Betaproteobacteria bacterium]|nr:Fe-S cluster assembly protein SufD [Betaproteobacteria bacterium]